MSYKLSVDGTFPTNLLGITTTITLNKKVGEGTYSGYLVTNALQRVTTDDIFIELQESPLDTEMNTFYMWTNYISGVIPVWGDQVVDASGISWTALKVDSLALNNCYKVLGRKVL